MTNPDRSELVKLADRLAALPTFEMEIVTKVPGVALNAAERDLIVTALRRLAEAGTQEAVKGACHRIALEHFDYYSEKHRAAVMAGNNAVYQAMSIGMSASEKIAKAIDALETSAPPAPSVAVKVKAQPLSKTRITLAAVDTAPPADTGMREALERCATICERRAKQCRRAADNPEMTDAQQEIWAALCNENLDNARAFRALTAPGATTKSDGVPGDTVGTGAAAAPIETGDAGIVSGLSDPTPSRPEVSVEDLARELQDVVAEIRAQNWKFGGVHLHDSEEAARMLARALVAKYHMEGRE